jgi:hypothetical protein
MQPNQWLELVDKHLTAPESVDETELASLRTNYIVWKAALTYFRNEIRNVLILETQKILKGRLLPEEDFAMVKTGLNKPESMTDDEWSQILALRDRTGPRISAICTAESLMDFYKKFDAEFQASTGDLPFEVREALWETRAKRLETAIANHRHAYVMANKQANGLDFLLWHEIGEPEFHPSRHAQMQKNGHITFKEM